MDGIAVVGGGFTGIVAAKALKAENVKIFEAASGLGGVLTDISCNEGEYFSGCQYLSTDGSWEKYFDTAAGAGLYEFEHAYGSYTDIFGEVSISEKVAMPIFDGLVDIGSTRLAGVQSLKDRLALYPAQIKNPVSAWFTYIGIDIEKVHHSAAIGFQASRVYPRKVEALARSVKKAEPEKDYLYGLPREILGKSRIRAKLPWRGYNHFCEGIRRELGDAVKLSSTVRLSKYGNKIALTVKGQEYIPDLVVWTVNPVPLFRELLSSKLDSICHVAEVLVGPVSKPVKSPFYIQVFSKNSRIMRLFFYNIDNRGAYTIEKAHDRQPDHEVIMAAQSIAKKFCEYRLGNPSARKKNNRYFAYSVDDALSINRFDKASHLENLITPNFLSYARDERVESVLASLSARGVL